MKITAYKKYLQQVKHAIPNTSSKKEMLLHIKYAIEAYVAEHPNYQYDDLITEFGSPDSITDTVLSFAEPQVIRKKLQRMRIMILGGIILLMGSFMTAIIIILLLQRYIDRKYKDNE